MAETDFITNAPDPFDLSRLRLPDDDENDLGVQELLVSVPYRKPSKEQFFRVHPDQAYRCTAGLVELKESDGEAYWVDKDLWPQLVDEPTFGKRLVVTTVNEPGLVFLWGLRLPGPDGKVPDWVSIPLEAAKSAEKAWTKLYWDQGQKKHRIRVAKGIPTEPAWPSQPLNELVRLAFKDRVITTLDHPVLARLRGDM